MQLFCGIYAYYASFAYPFHTCAGLRAYVCETRFIFIWS